MTERLITEQQEKIIRACHHDFDGLSQAEASEKLGISRSIISDELKQIEKVMPNWFPLLTKLEITCYHYYMVEGWEVSEIAEYLGRSKNAIYKALLRAKDKGQYFPESSGRILNYDPSMDCGVKKQF